MKVYTVVQYFDWTLDVQSFATEQSANDYAIALWRGLFGGTGYNIPREANLEQLRELADDTGASAGVMLEVFTQEVRP